MIATLRGEVTAKYGSALVIETGGVGYEVAVTSEDWGAASVGKETSLFIYEQIREDAHNLYGFGELAAKAFFVQLLSVSGVGPKVALAILSATSLERLHQAISAGDPDLLKGVSGIGKKTAERIMVELRGKVTATGVAASTDSTYQALVGLGYSPDQAAGAVSKLPAELTDEAERVRSALKGLSR
jgi:Holliday junction DNA helicase RuvA